MGQNLKSIKNIMGAYDSSYEDKLKKARRLERRWEPTGLLEGLEGIHRANMAILLENQARELIKEETETGTSAGSEEWSGVALPLVRKIFGEVAAKDFVSVQPMSLPSGLAFYVEFTYANTKMPYTAGGSVYGTLTGAGSPSGGLYGAGRYSYSVNTVTASVTAATGSATWADVNYDADLSASIAAEKIYTLTFQTASLTTPDLLAVRSFGVTTGSNDSLETYFPAFTKVSGGNIQMIVSGSGTVPGPYYIYYSKQPTANTRGDFEKRSNMATGTDYGQFNIPELNMELTSLPLVAKTRKLKASWTPEISQDLAAYHSIDAEAELTAMLSEQITTEIDLEVLDMLISQADNTEYWSAQPGFEWDSNVGRFERNTSFYIQNKFDWYKTLAIKLQKASNMIYAKTLRGGANFCVVSPTVSTILDSMPGYSSANTTGNLQKYNMGIELAGSIANQIQVYKNPYQQDNLVLMGFRGSSFLETGAVFAPYIPLIMTPLLYDPNTLVPRKGIMTRYAKKMLLPQFYAKVYIHGLNTV